MSRQQTRGCGAAFRSYDGRMAELEFNAVATPFGEGVSADALVGILARTHGLPEAQRRMRDYLDQLAARAGDPEGERAVSRPPPRVSSTAA
jgi:hypothetical protein